ncbi:hypothetical protein [Pseudomonas poae]|uniref:Uncharacterized protein n=1 Tax=Pseudomonas poae TaxID=200451 RepID=A0A2S9EXX3_9PSED|nr:hypothetical protein [Pseudomonas poae]PRA29785.1 hypothetical protein CQZ97_12430 [Pseudomonas poae]PRC21814.1 hypothetical protein CQZ99_03180 [Pseudomonas poae]
MVEQNKPQTSTDRMHAEVSRIFAEISRMQAEQDKLKAEQEKLRSESMKINCETFWYPMGVAMAVVATIASVTGMAIKLLL